MKLLKTWLSVLLFLTILMGASTVLASPCVPDESVISTYRQDGSLTERQAFVESLNLDQTSPSLIARAKARESGISTSSAVPPEWQGMPTTGNARIIMLHVDFPDYAFEANDTPDALNAIAFGENADSYPYDSLKNYYERSSYGKLTITGDTFSYTAAYPRDHYTQDTAVLVEEALAALDDSVDFSQYDGDNDNLLDGVYLHFAGGDTGWGSPWWSYKNNAGRVPQFDGKILYNFVFLAENPTTANAAATLIHETGHMLGLPDYYAFPDQTGAGIKTPDMMNNNTGDHNLFSKWLLGWLDDDDLIRVDSAQTLEKTFTLMPASSDTPSGLIVAPEDKGMFSEYFLIQYDDPTLNNQQYAGLSSPFFRIYHINATLNEAGTNFACNSNYANPEAPLLIEAVSGRDAFYNDFTDNMALTPESTPSSAFFGGDYAGWTGAVINGFDHQTGAVTVRFDPNRPPAPELKLTANTNLEHLSNIPSFTLTASTNVHKNPDNSVPVVLKAADGTCYPMNVQINQTQVTLTLAEPNQLPFMNADTDYTLLFPESYFKLADDLYSDPITLSVRTGAIQTIDKAGPLDPSSAYFITYSNPVSLADGQVIRALGIHPEGEAVKPYFERLILRVTDCDLNTSDLSVSGLSDLSNYTGLELFALKDDTLALVLTDLNGHKSAHTLLPDGTLSDAGQPIPEGADIFAADGRLFFYRTLSDENRVPYIELTKTDLTAPPVQTNIHPKGPNADIALYPVCDNYFLIKNRQYSDQGFTDYLKLYQTDSLEPIREMTTANVNTLLGATVYRDQLFIFSSDYLQQMPDTWPSLNPRTIEANLFVDTYSLDSAESAYTASTLLGTFKLDTFKSNAIQFQSSDESAVLTSAWSVPNNAMTNYLNYTFIDLDHLTVRSFDLAEGNVGCYSGGAYFMSGINPSDYTSQYFLTTPLSQSHSPDGTDPSLPTDPQTPDASQTLSPNAATGITSSDLIVSSVLLLGLLLAASIILRHRSGIR